MNDNSVSARRTAVLILVVIAGAAALALWTHRPPRPLPDTAPVTEFSAMRAVQHIEVFATEPHRAGTEANYRVRDYIVATMTAIGASPLVSNAPMLHKERETGRSGKGFLGSLMEEQKTRSTRQVLAASPENILVRLPGTASTKAFLMMAHYDSVPFGPGASDDGAGVATLIEAYRALKAAPPLKNDVIFLFTDGEEGGLRGAESFLNHEWFSDVGLMVNFESRGGEPSYVFQVKRPTGWLVAEAAKCAPYPAMSSLMFDLYDRTPFATDYDVLKPFVPGFDVSNIGGFCYYHTPNDKPANVNLRSLQHHGSYAMGFARHFGNMSLDSIPSQPDAVYFNPLGSMLIQYPDTWAKPLAAAEVVKHFETASVIN